MLTRLKVKGFKNLADVDVQFGPFTCIAGANGVGKSNLFDAVTFLSSLSSVPLIEAARQVRDSRTRSTDIRSLFFEGSDSDHPRMSFDVEMLVSPVGVDDFGQTAKASITFLKYGLTLALLADEDSAFGHRLALVREELTHINKGEAKDHLWFPHHSEFRRTAVTGVRRGGQFISTEQDRVKLHQDGQSGNPRNIPTQNLVRTVLSGITSMEYPTALLAKREMQSWRLLQLEPSSLRQPDSLSSPVHIGSDGSHCPATLHHLTSRSQANEQGERTRSRIAARLSELNEDVRDVEVELDQQRELLTILVTDRNGARHAARALSDGTLRFLTLAILEQDIEASGVICFEEPENGIHPARIPAMLDLLKGLCVNPDEEIGPYNRLRQVIVNTHSPAVVGLVEQDELLVAERVEIVGERGSRSAVRFASMPESRRRRPDMSDVPVSLGKLHEYLGLPIDDRPEVAPSSKAVRDVLARRLHQKLLFIDE